MKTIKKDDLIKRYGIDSPCQVKYVNNTQTINYSSLQHVNWNNVVKITVMFKKPKTHFDKRGDGVSRLGSAYKII